MGWGLEEVGCAHNYAMQSRAGLALAQAWPPQAARATAHHCVDAASLAVACQTGGPLARRALVVVWLAIKALRMGGGDSCDQFVGECGLVGGLALAVWAQALRPSRPAGSRMPQQASPSTHPPACPHTLQLPPPPGCFLGGGGRRTACLAGGGRGQPNRLGGGGLGREGLRGRAGWPDGALWWRAGPGPPLGRRRPGQHTRRRRAWLRRGAGPGWWRPRAGWWLGRRGGAADCRAAANGQVAGCQRSGGACGVAPNLWVMQGSHLRVSHGCWGAAALWLAVQHREPPAHAAPECISTSLFTHTTPNTTHPHPHHSRTLIPIIFRPYWQSALAVAGCTPADR